jgi:hypothetical protein
MSVKPGIFSIKTLKRLAAIAVVVLIAHYGFAVDGAQGGKKSSRVYSSIKTNLNFSLKSMYSMNNQRNFQVKRSTSMYSPYSITTFHKGNQTWVVPGKSNVKILQKFKTPSR